MSNPTETKLILVADDSLTIRKLVETVLCEEGYTVITVETGAGCLEQAAAQKPSLILLDYILPDMQGTDVCRSLINSPETWEVPVLMMSSNGNAIRQLYQDLNNVADYLTKPFAPSVLKAVVGHLLQKEKPAESGTSSSAEASAVAATAAPMQKEFMDKVTRLLALMEGQPASNGVPSGTETAVAATSPVARPAKPRRSRKTVAAAPAPESVVRKFRTVLQKHLRARMQQIPDWESRRGMQDSEGFFLSRILAKDVLCDLSADLVRATGTPPGAAGALNCPSALVPLDAVLRHLHASRATGELRIELAEETVLAGYEQGQVVLLTSNHPRNYCAGAACDFQAVPHAVIGEAVQAQQEQSLPFFVSLKNAGHLPAEAPFETLLREQGGSCLQRAFKASQSVAIFSPLARLSATARACKLPFPLNQLLLGCYRTVDDWFTLEKLFQDMEATLVPSPGLESQLEQLALETEELRLLKAVCPGQTISELAGATGLKTFEVCRILFRFVKLGLIRHGPHSSLDARVDEDVPVPATAEKSPADQSEPASPVENGATSSLVDAPATGPAEPEVPVLPEAAPLPVPAPISPAEMTDALAGPDVASCDSQFPTAPADASEPTVEIPQNN